MVRMLQSFDQNSKLRKKFPLTFLMEWSLKSERKFEKDQIRMLQRSDSSHFLMEWYTRLTKKFEKDQIPNVLVLVKGVEVFAWFEKARNSHLLIVHSKLQDHDK